MALLLIVALSVGFFAGLKITQDAMTAVCDDYLSEQNFYDYRLISTAGFTEEDLQALSELSFIGSAEGTHSVDALVSGEDGDEPFKLLALPDEVNLPSLTAGRMPESTEECLADARAFDEEDIGSTIRISDENDAVVLSQFSGKEFTITGLVHSPLYLNTDRGSTGLGNGSLSGFLYLSEENFTAEVYTEICLTLAEKAPAYSEEYDDLISWYEDEVMAECEKQTAQRFRMTEAFIGMTPEIYILTRGENAGYVSFENDTSILSGVADIFPVFFILIAILVCITTMTRMVDEERTQIGVLKAMGYSRAAVTAKYLLYAGSATLIGWAVGFFAGTWGLPRVFWYAYSALYGFAPMSYLFRPSLAFLTLAVALAGILGSTWLSCRRELSGQPAELIRPRSAKEGKRILLERIAPLWKRLSFLQKVTLRNMFRYKKRLLMMLIGISCCTGLIVTAFGVRDSMIHVGSLQYENVQKYDIEASLSDGSQQEAISNLENTEGVSGVARLSDTQKRVDDALSCLNYIIWLIVLFSGALAFIVIFNLTNINLAERSREIATVEVLGFYPEETDSYVLRENLVLSVIAGLIGLPLGTLFHRIVMNRIDIESMSFDVRITAVSYVLALICTVLFAVIINLFMRRQIGKIQMTESLKAVE